MNVQPIQVFLESNRVVRSISLCHQSAPIGFPNDTVVLDTNGDGAINHSAMFLAYDSATGDLITLDGNTNGRVDLDDTRSFSGANAASVRRRGIDALMTWGTLDIRMVR